MSALPPLWAEPLALGFSVIPCHYGSKVPAMPWEAYQTTRADDVTVAAWASCQYNVGIATGAVSGVWVLDTDSEEAEAALIALAGPEGIPATLSVRTPRGRHRYWRHTGVRLGNRTKIAKVKGLDARGDGGYAMAPGSFYVPTPIEHAEGKLPGGYAWEMEPRREAILPAPIWLTDMVMQAQPPASEWGDLALPATATVTSEYGARALMSEVAILRAAGAGERNDQLNRSAFAMSQLVHGGDIVAQEASHALWHAARAIGLEDDEISHTLNSGWKAGARQPRKGKDMSAAAVFGGSNIPLPPGEAVVDRSVVLPSDLDTMFAGCVWVTDANRVWTGRELMDKSRFDVVRGGMLYPIANEGRPTASAWDAFTMSRLVRPPIVDSTCFRPELPSGAVIEEESGRLLNTYVPIETRVVSGDAAPFLEFLAKLLPVPGDREIILAYMASLVQHPGKKFQWWPVVQGCEGNGKSLLLRCLTHAVGRRYTHLPNAPDLARNGMKFNAWVTGNLLCGVEEISLGNKRDFLEEFKPVVTNDRIPIERKGVDQVTGDNRINGILMTNHQDGVPVTVDTRRYAVFHTAQQSKSDKARDGMLGSYFPGLYRWLEADGYAIVNGFLRGYRVPVALDPAGDCVEAPTTSSSAAAILASLGPAEQEVLDAIGDGRAGFCGGWVSSRFLDALLASLKMRIAPNKRRAMMRGLGYDWHPALTDGRTNGIVQPDNAKPRLYIRHGHPDVTMTDPLVVANNYTAAQQGAVAVSNVISMRDYRDSFPDP